MKRILLFLIALIPALCYAQKADAVYVAKLSEYLKGEETYLNANKLTEAQMRKMLVATFPDKKDDADFSKALENYFAPNGTAPSKCGSILMQQIAPYFYKNLTVEQLDSLMAYASSVGLKRAVDGLTKYAATYKDKKGNTSLLSIAQQTNKRKKKALLKMVSQEDLDTYIAYVNSGAYKGICATKKALQDDTYNIQAAVVTDFQTWTYKAYPSLFTKKQKAPKKGRRGRKSKNKAPVKTNDDTIIDGGILH